MDVEPDSEHSKHVTENREHWEKLLQQSTAVDAVYRAEEFLEGESALLPIEEEELGNIEGKKLLDLQCFVGVRTLSWARKGATVTGVDISAEAIELSQELAAETGLENQADFIETNIDDLPEIHSERYDVVFTNFGVLCWMPDIERWAAVVAEFLKPGGTFYLAEYHPVSEVLSYDFDSDEAPISMEHSYFSTETPITSENEPPHKWIHGLGNILSALIEAGVELSFVHEYPYLPIELYPEMVEDENGCWRFETDVDLPLMVTVKGKLKR